MLTNERVLQLVSENRSGLIRLRLASLSLAPGQPFLFSLFNIIDISLTMVFTTTTININTITIIITVTMLLIVTRTVQQQTVKTLFPPHLLLELQVVGGFFEDTVWCGNYKGALSSLMMITMFCHNTECHTDNQWIVTNSWCQASYLFFKSGNISLYYLCMCTLCRPHQLEQIRAIGLWEIWPESNENHQYLILISLRLDGNPFLGLKLQSIKFQNFRKASSNNLSNELIF